jgi:hypothetical protein
MKREFALMTLALAVLAIGVARAQDGRRSDDRGDYRHDYGEGVRIAYNVGYQDGMQVAREDSGRRKPFNPYPRGHNHADRGYRYEFGSLSDYREHYAQAYHEGYERAYQGDYGHGYSR